MVGYSRWIWLLSVVVFGTNAGCSDGEGSKSDGEVSPRQESAMLDNFPSNIPAVADDVRVFQLSEQVIDAGSEVQFCHYLEPLEEDLYVRKLQSFQGQYGHHLVFFLAVSPEEPGTVRECSAPLDMVLLRPAIISSNFGLSEFPEGMAIRLPKGAQLVAQQHYVNAGLKPMRVRDELHLTTLSKDNVKQQLGFFGLSDIGFQLDPDGGEQEVSFRCTVPEDTQILMVGGHMHEQGVRFMAELEYEEDTKTLLEVPEWEDDFRDLPPVSLFDVATPLKVAGGDVIHTRCVFENGTGKPVEFPQEMCATYGYFFPAEPGNEVWICSGEK